MYINKLADRSRGQTEASFSICIKPKSREERYSFLWIALIILVPYIAEY